MVNTGKSKREKEVCEMLLKGMTQKEMAQTLGLKTRTIKMYLWKLYLRNHITGGGKAVKLTIALMDKK